MKSILLIVFTVILALLAGCADVPREATYENISRIFMNKVGSYTILVENEKGELLPVNIYCDVYVRSADFESKDGKPVEYPESIIKIIPDVPEGEMMSIEHKWTTNSFAGGGCNSLEIHVHAAESIEGGEWNNGKFGTGPVKLIE